MAISNLLYADAKPGVMKILLRPFALNGRIPLFPWLDYPQLLFIAALAYELAYAHKINSLPTRPLWGLVLLHVGVAQIRDPSQRM